MDALELEKLMKKYRKKPLFDTSELSTTLDLGKAEIERIIPHRDPLLFVDRLTGLDLSAGRIAGERVLDPSDPVFQGHFPQMPLYPGNLTIEMIGQLGLCMYYFVSKNRNSIGDDAQPVPARATRIAGAYYLEPIAPGSRVKLLAQKLDFDGYFASMIGQAIVNDKVAVVTIGEVIILED
jgi:3-hydroxymyristoyl/3-hydroxydecanoyl-(acyl carrier protein) dehydratase